MGDIKAADVLGAFRRKADLADVETQIRKEKERAIKVIQGG